MGDTSDFVNVREYTLVKLPTLEGQRKYYKLLIKEIEEILEEKKKFDILLKEDNLSEEAKDFRYALNLYNTAMGQLNTVLAVDIADHYANLRYYLYLCQRIKDKKEIKREILTRNINFQSFGVADGHYSELCSVRHGVICDDGDLVCIFCGASTKGYSLSKEDKEFLSHCAKVQGMFLEVTKNDLPLLNVLIEEKKERLRKRTPLHEMEENHIMGYMDWAEEYYLEDDRILFDLELEIIRGHMLDDRIFETEDYKVGNPEYLDSKKADQLLHSIKLQILEVQNSTSKFRELQLEICRTFWYEVLILSGASIPELYNSATNEGDKVALVKAYYNLSNKNYRVHSGYFSPKHNDAIFYDCRTAHPEINQRILEMKMKR